MAAHRRIFVFTVTPARCAPVVVTSVIAMLIHVLPVRDESFEMKMDEPGRNKYPYWQAVIWHTRNVHVNCSKDTDVPVCINATVMKTHIKQFTARNATLFCSHILSRRRPVWEIVLVIQVQSVLTENNSVLYKTVFCDCIYFIDNFFDETEMDDSENKGDIVIP
jgi:hypothetical protein